MKDTQGKKESNLRKKGKKVSLKERKQVTKKESKQERKQESKARK